MSIPFIIDAVLVGIVAVYLLIGLNRGALKTVIDLFGTVASIIVSVVIVNFLGAFLLEIEPIKNFVVGEAGSIAAWIKGFVPDFGGLTVGASAAEIEAAMSGGLMGAFLPYLTKFIEQLSGGSNMDMTIQAALANMGAISLYYTVLTLIIFVVLRVLFAQLEKAAESMRKQAIIKSLDNFVGMVVGAVKGAVVVSVLLLAVTLLTYIPFVNGLIAPYWEQTFIAKPVADFLMRLIKEVFNLDALIAKLFGGA